MSKASEWAAKSETIQEKIDALEEERGEFKFMLSPFLPSSSSVHVVAFVMDEGHLHLSAYDATLIPEQALALARWILDTFGEPTA